MTNDSGRRLAMVVATTEYDDSRLARLAAPLSDALELARTLGDHGGFEVESLVNAEAQTVQRRLERFCKAGRQRSDVLLVYLTGHGVKDDDGNLYFALRDTDRDLLRTTALSADLLSSILNESPAGSQILMLDCCYSGAISRALRPKGTAEIDLGGTFGGGRGRVVLAASGAVEQAWEGASGSLYTHAVVEGITTGAADLNSDGRITASEIHSYTAERLRAEGRQSPRKFEFDEAGALVVARPGNRAAPPAPVAPITAAPSKSIRAPSKAEPSGERPVVEPQRRRAPAWIPGMLAVALAAALGTLWLTGAIAFLPSPLATTTTTTAAVPPIPSTSTSTVAPTTSALVTTAAVNPTSTVDLVSTTEAVTTTAAPVDFVLVFEELFDDNASGWTEGEFSDDSGTSFFQFFDGNYESGFSVASADQAYYSVVPFTPGEGLFYIETETTSLLAGSRCGLAIQNGAGSLFVAAVGDGELVVKLFVGDALATEGSYDVAIAEAQQTEVGLWIERSSITIYLDDVEVDTFVEPAVAGIQQVGVGLLGDFEAQCAYNYLSVWNG